MILKRNEKDKDTSAARRGVNSAKIEKQTKREVQNKSELNCGLVATLVEREKLFFNLVRD